jgi:hypothetical protein
MLKLNVGCSRKVGEANYGSRGASVSLELEFESILATDPQLLQARIRSLFRSAQAAVDEELSGSRQNSNGNNQVRSHDDKSGAAVRECGRSSPRPATAPQVRAIHAIASRQRIDLPNELQKRFDVEYPDDLSVAEASEFIDSIKPPANGNGRP